MTQPIMQEALISALENSNSKYTIGLLQVYETYKNKDQVSKEQFFEICKMFNHTLMRILIETGNTYVLPCRLGTISIRKRKRSTKKAFNLKLYLQEGIRSYYDNRHSSGYYARFDWNKRPPVAAARNIGMVKFIPARSHKRLLASKIINENYIVKYFDHD